MLAGTFLTTGALVLIVLAFGDQLFELPALWSSLTISGAGVGGLVAAFLISPRIRDSQVTAVCTGIYVFITISFFILATANGFAMLFLAMFVADTAVTLSFIVLATFRQALTPTKALGRIAGASSALNAGIVTAAAAMAGLLMTYIGLRPTAVVWAVMLGVVTLGTRLTKYEGSLNSLAERAGSSRDA